MSFFLTTEQVMKETKTVTRRLGWNHATPGMYCWAVEKAQGIKKGELKRLKLIRIKSVKQQKLFDLYISKGMEEATLEGFPNMLDEEFARFFCEKMKCDLGQVVNRIEFEYVKDYSGRLLEMGNKEINDLIKHTIDPVYRDSGLLQWRDDYNFFEHGSDLKRYPPGYIEQKIHPNTD